MCAVPSTALSLGITRFGPAAKIMTLRLAVRVARQLAARPAAGTSSMSSKRWRRQPVFKSQDRALATGGSGPPGAIPRRQPSNHHADENGSMP
jgi:hypothetical protein